MHKLLETAADLRAHGLVSDADLAQLEALQNGPDVPSVGNTEAPTTK